MSDFSVFKAKEEQSKRSVDELAHEFRGEFDRDRDRILYSKAFRRLSGKTQVFVVGNDDHMRTRLTHTLEVSQISQTISKKLGLNETLTEAIALGHDIGHTPFGHVGERTINYIINGCYTIKDFNRELDDNQKGFKHNWQGLRVVMDLEQISSKYCGLNLTDYTAWGILNHSNKKYKECKKKVKDEQGSICNLLLNRCDCKSNPDNDFCLDFYSVYNNVLNSKSWTLEGLIVSMADEIAQRHHDVEDGIEAKILNSKVLIEKFEYCFGSFLNESDRELIEHIKGEKEKVYYLPSLSKLIVNFLTTRLINDTSKNLKEIIKEFDITNEHDFYERKNDIEEKWGIDNIVCYNEDFKKREEEFQVYLRDRILNSHKAQTMDGKADYIIRQLFKAYVTNPQQLPDKTIITLYVSLLTSNEFNNLKKKYDIEELTGILRSRLESDHSTRNDKKYKSTLLRTICDYIAGMSDNYALHQYATLYGSNRVSV